MAEEQTASADAGTKPKKKFGITFKVSAKGAVSVYGLGRFPVTLYREQWVRLLEHAGELERFMEEHAGELKVKGEGGEPAPTEAAAAVEDPDLPPDDYHGE